MTTRAEREVLLQGLDPTTNAIIGFLATKGWKTDWLLRNIATKQYGPNHATIRVELDSVNCHHHVTGEYHSAGDNALSGLLVVPDSATPEEVNSLMVDYLNKAEKSIANSFAGRFLS